MFALLSQKLSADLDPVELIFVLSRSRIGFECSANNGENLPSDADLPYLIACAPRVSQ